MHMDAVEFLSRVLPEDGPYLLAWPIKFREKASGKLIETYRHIDETDVLRLAARAGTLVNYRGEHRDMYFALGSVFIPRKPKDQSGFKVRGHANINQVRSFWVDLDVDPDNTAKYSSQAEAVRALKQFCSSVAFPLPAVVSSGYGIHAYWPMTESVDARIWTQYAEKFKAVMKQHGVRQDPSRTSDCATILRVPGTYNFKRDATEQVKILASGGVTGTDTLLSAIDRMFEEIRGEVPESKNVIDIPGERPEHLRGIDASKINKAAGNVGDTNTAVKATRVVKSCQQLAWQLTHQDEVSEPQWYDMIGCLRFADEGEKIVHRMSERYTGYSASETDSKIQQHKDGDFGPTLCSTFDDHNPGGCDGCPHAGRVKTPLVLGRELKSVPAPTYSAPESEEQIEIPLPPEPFKRSARDDGTVFVVMATEDAKGNVREFTISDHDLYPTGITYDEHAQSYVASVRRYLPRDGWFEFRIPLGKLLDSRAMASMLGAAGVVPDPGNIQYVVAYMTGFVREIQKKFRASIEYAQLGWRTEEDGTVRFVTPNAITDGTVIQAVTPSENTVAALQWEQPTGAVETWAQMAEMYARPGCEAHQLAVMASFAAPIFAMTPHTGMIISLVGSAGSGKTSAVRLGGAVWGHDKHNWADLERDSEKGFYNKLGVLRNLPVVYDEITNLEERKLSDLCYTVSKGTGRQTLTQDSRARLNQNNWRTMMITTSNASLHSRLSLSKADAGAEMARVFEVRVPPSTIPKQEADAALAPIATNYGVVGPVFAKELVKHRARVKDRLLYWSQQIELHAQVTSAERFWSAAPASVLAAVELTNSMKLTRYSVEGLFNFIVGAIKEMRVTVDESVRSTDQLLAEYLSRSIRGTVVLETASIPHLVAVEPTSDLHVRIESWHEVAVISRPDFFKFCISNRADISTIRKDLKDMGAYIDERKFTIGKGTKYKTGQPWCIFINLGCKALGGYQALSQEAVG